MHHSQLISQLIAEGRIALDPESAVDQFAATLRSYGVNSVTGDRYAAQWSAQSFEKRKIRYVPSELPKSGLYGELLPRLMAKKIRLVDDARLVNQIASLERRTARGGKDSIDHPPSGHDDVANVVAGLAAITARSRNTFIVTELRL